MKKWEESGFPFAAIRGQDSLKMALLLSCVNPKIGGVLAVGGKGCGKSTMMRSVQELTKRRLVELPLNCSLDRLTGSMALAETVRTGKKQYDAGILEQAQGQFLYCDEINLLPDSLMYVLMTEREIQSDPWVLLGTMNPEEGRLTAHVLDRFGICVEVHGSREPEERLEILKSVLAYERDPEAFRARFAEETDRLRRQIQQASAVLSCVEIPEEEQKFAVDICREAGCSGSRGELYLIETARALAAWEQTEQVTDAHIRQAAGWVLPHRMRKEEPEAVSAEPDRNDPAKQGQEEEHSSQNAASESQVWESFLEPQDFTQEVWNTDKVQKEGTPENLIFLSEEGVFQAVLPKLQPGRKKRKGCGKRSRTRTAVNGRMVRATLPVGTCTDLALAATLRAAAPYQKSRKREHLAICIEKSDFREKVRECRMGASILFVVDASRSMKAERRMAFAKGAVLSILKEAYCKRDQVGMITFRNDRADLCLGFTRSVELAKKRLEQLPVGGNTPLALGLTHAWQYLNLECQKNKDLQPMLVLLTDGKANASSGENPFEDALQAARVFANKQIPSLVINTETGFLRMGFAEQIAEAMNASCIPLDALLPGGIRL